MLDRIVSLLDISIETSGHLLVQAKALKNYDFDAVNHEYDAIDNLEGKVDIGHRSLVREIATGSFFGGIREDLITLLEIIDNIPDAAKGAAQIFHERQFPKEVVDYLFQEEEGDVEAFITTCIKATEIFREAIKALEKSKDEVLSLVEKVEETEEDADNIRYKIVKHLFKNEINAKSLDIIMLKDFLVTTDDIADNAEHGSDVLRILVAKGYS